MSAIKKSNVTLKEAVNFFDYAIIIALARVNGDTMYESYGYDYGLKELLQISLSLPVLIYLTVEALRNSGGFKTTLLCFTV